MLAAAARKAELKLSADGLACLRGDRLIFDDVSFSVTGGEVVTLLGPNGVGKTTLLRVLGGLLRPSAGFVSLAGVAKDGPHHVHAHFVGPQDALKSAMTVRENLVFWQRYLGDGSSDDAALVRALDVLDLVDLADIPAGFLSTGQKRRAGLARLIAVHRPVWLLDEPTLGLDVASRRILSNLLSEHVATGGLALVATHADLGLGSVRALRLGLEVTT